MRMLLVATAVLALGASSSAAFGHDYDPYDWQHQYDHQEHGDYHDDEARAHALAHELGLADDPYSHARLHEALEERHERFHAYHPGTWHDHYRQRAYQYDEGDGYSPYGYGYEGQSPYGDSEAYGYSPY